MRTLRILSTGLVLAFSISIAARADVTGSVHDLSGDGYGSDEICRFCHDPHDQGGAAYGDLGLLWDHEVSTVTDFTMYNEGPGINDIQNAMDTTVTGVSLFCLGCHDGTVGVDEFNGQATAGGNTMTDINAAKVVGSGGDLSNTHPIGITYDDTVDTGLNPDSTALGAGTIAEYLEGGTGGKVQCGTCHDVHNGTAFSYLLRDAVSAAEGTASGLCLACHNK